MINRLDYFTTTINYTCSPVCIRFSINKVIIGRAGKGRAILSRSHLVVHFPDFRFRFRERWSRVGYSRVHPLVYDLECLVAGRWSLISGRFNTKLVSNPHFSQKWMNQVWSICEQEPSEEIMGPVIVQWGGRITHEKWMILSVSWVNDPVNCNGRIHCVDSEAPAVPAAPAVVSINLAWLELSQKKSQFSAHCPPTSLQTANNI